MTPRALGLYVHIPFCRQRCHFCAFYLELARAERIEAFCSALAKEIDLYRDHGLIAGRPLRSIYFGGGTPTVIPVRRLTALLDRMRRTWATANSVEVTIEAHPSTVTRDDLRILVDAGVTRLSLGAESMNEQDFIAIGRPGTVADTETAVREARAAGFANINLDVMFGLPGQTIESWMQTLRSLVALVPDHISCYALTVEPGTRFAHDIAREPALQPDDALQTAMAEAAEAFLASAGYRRYEISNYAKPGMECRHNLLYWTDQDYLGLGPSAQSYIDGVRFGAMADVTSYVDSLQNGRLPIVDHIDLSAAERQRDALVFGLRLVEGVPQETVESALDTPASQRSLARLIGAGLVEACGERVRLTKLGRRYADTVAGELF